MCTLLVVCLGPSAAVDDLRTESTFGQFELGEGDTRSSDIEELEKEMLDLDVIVSARQAKTGRSLESVPSGVVKFPDESF